MSRAAEAPRRIGPDDGRPSSDRWLLQVPPAVWARRRPELCWVCEVVLGRWLGLPVWLQPGAADGLYRLQWCLAERVRAEVCWPEAFFSQAEPHWGQPRSLPAAGRPRWTIPAADLRARIGEPDLAWWFGDGLFAPAPQAVGDPEAPGGAPVRVRLPIDVTGSVFFQLARYEEAVAGAPRDAHGRFPGAASLAQRDGLLQRPLVDEWVALLSWAIGSVLPDWRRPPQAPRTWVSCDVDAPFAPAGYGLLPMLRQAASHALHERSPRLVARALGHGLASRVGLRRFDPYDCFDWMHRANAAAGQPVTWFWLALAQPARRDALYTLDEPRVQALLRRQLAQGDEIGLHGSYASVDQADELAAQWQRLRAAVRRAGGEADRVQGARQHYLRWHGPDTARQLEGLRAQGLAWDSTLAYSDAAGFRCGTSHAFPMFDLARREALGLVQRPLVLMEVTVTSPVYLGLGHGEAAHTLMHQIKARCRRFGGRFGLLWHNSNLVLPEARALYTSLLGD